MVSFVINNGLSGHYSSTNHWEALVDAIGPHVVGSVPVRSRTSRDPQPSTVDTITIAMRRFVMRQMPLQHDMLQGQSQLPVQCQG